MSPKTFIMIPPFMRSHTDPNLPLSPVVVNTNKPSMACANRERSRRGYARPTSSVVRLTADALALIDNSRGGITPALVGKTKTEAVATILLDMTARKSPIYVKIAKSRKP